MKHRVGLALLFCSLAVGCGRTPIAVFPADMRSEEVFDPWVDGCCARAKGGNPESVVVLSIAHTQADTCTRSGHATQANTLMAFTRRFEHGLTESICASSFEGSFKRATDVIQAACGE